MKPPRQIWLLDPNTGYPPFAQSSAEWVSEDDKEGGIPYVRADIHEELARKLYAMLEVADAVGLARKYGKRVPFDALHVAACEARGIER